MNAPEPTYEQIDAHAVITWKDEHRKHEGMACWYPSMGGYVGKCVVELADSEPDGCVDVYVWHDGQFPFAGEGEFGKPPTILHHCCPDHFIEFGQLVTNYLEWKGPSPVEEGKLVEL